ncbi:MAG: D-alanyl-D-alanine carboxypeptidase [Spirochaetales bacterium]|nr:D-alanyl-D-alanine carboxypeptidase [Spirochaetales bacterium]
MTRLLLLCICVLPVHALDKPDITGKAALTIDVDTGEIIYAKNIDRRLYPASTTKLITAVMLAKNKSRDDILTYSEQAGTAFPYKLFIPAGSWMRATYAMDALLVYSANDIAYMIAENIDGTIEKFAHRMNTYVQKELGLKDTHFMNPSGLHSVYHYSSAYELSIIAREVYAYPWIMKTLGKKRSVLRINDEKEITINNRNKLVLENRCTGGKTGWTPEAGHCLVSFFERDKRRIIGVILGAQSRFNPEETTVFEDMEKIINYSYMTKKELLIKADSTVKTVTFTFRVVPFLGPVTHILKLQVKEDVSIYMHGGPLQIFFTVPPVNILDLHKNKPAGFLTVKQRLSSEVFSLYPAVSFHDIMRWDILPFYTAVISIGLFIALLISFMIFILRKKRKRVSLFTLFPFF